MKRDLQFLHWHIARGAEIEDPGACTCALGLIWEISETFEQAETRALLLPKRKRPLPGERPWPEAPWRRSP